MQRYAALLMVALVLAGCASSSSTSSSSSQATSAERSSATTAKPATPMAGFAGLDNRQLIDQVRGALFGAQIPEGEQRYARARAALDELANRGTGELFERVWMTIDEDSFSTVQSDPGSKSSIPVGENRSSRKRLNLASEVLGPKPMVEYRVLAYSKLEALAAQGYGVACSTFRRAYGLTPNGRNEAKRRGVETGLRKPSKGEPVLGVAGHPKWDDLTWQSVGATPVALGLPISKPGRYRYSGYATISIPEPVISGCKQAGRWTSLTQADRSLVGVSEPGSVTDELEAMRQWASNWDVLLRRFEDQKHTAAERWQRYERNYRFEAGFVALQLDQQLVARGGSMQYNLPTALKRVNQWIGNQRLNRYGPERHIFVSGGEYAGRQLAILNEEMAKYAMRKMMAAEEAKLLKNGVALSAKGTPLHFIAVAGEAFGEPLRSQSGL